MSAISGVELHLWPAISGVETLNWPRGSAVYSYGVVLWELLTGEVPWVKLHPMQVRPHACVTPGRFISHLCGQWVPLPTGVVIHGLEVARMIDAASSLKCPR